MNVFNLSPTYFFFNIGRQLRDNSFEPYLSPKKTIRDEKITSIHYNLGKRIISFETQNNSDIYELMCCQVNNCIFKFIMFPSYISNTVLTLWVISYDQKWPWPTKIDQNRFVHCEHKSVKWPFVTADCHLVESILVKI